MESTALLNVLDMKPPLKKGSSLARGSCHSVPTRWGQELPSNGCLLGEGQCTLLLSGNEAFVAAFEDCTSPFLSQIMCSLTSCTRIMWAWGEYINGILLHILEMYCFLSVQLPLPLGNSAFLSSEAPSSLAHRPESFAKHWHMALTGLAVSAGVTAEMKSSDGNLCCSPVDIYYGAFRYIRCFILDLENWSSVAIDGKKMNKVLVLLTGVDK